MKHLLTTTAALALSAGLAHAAPIPIATLAADYNVIVQGNASTTSEYIGPAMIGGNFSSTGMVNSSNTVLPIPIPGAGELTVFGNTTGNFIARQNVVIGGTNGATIIGEASLSVGPIPINFATDVWAPLVSWSAAATGLAANAGFNSATSAFTGLHAGSNIVDVTAAQLHAATGPLLFPGLGPTDTLIVNVSGLSFTNPAPLFGGPSPRENVIFNFSDATSVSINNEWWASIVAPFAAFTNTAPVDGLVVAASGMGFGELHFFPPDSRVFGVPFSVDPIPEPSSVALLGMGLLGAWVIRRFKASEGRLGRLLRRAARPLLQAGPPAPESAQVWPL